MQKTLIIMCHSPDNNIFEANEWQLKNKEQLLGAGFTRKTLCRHKMGCCEGDRQVVKLFSIKIFFWEKD